MQVGYRVLPSQRRFGVELEVSNNLSKKALAEIVESYEFWYGGIGRDVVVSPGKKGWAETRCNSYWHVKYDSTCGPQGKDIDSGWEIASYIGQGVRDVKYISGLADFLARHKAEVNKHCGLHIHVEANDFVARNMGVLLARWLQVEHFLIHICDRSRWCNPYCRSVRSRLDDRLGLFAISYLHESPSTFWKYMRPTDFSTHCNEDKKYMLNTVGVAIGEINPSHDRRTIELRLPEGRLSTEHVRNWIKLIVNFVDVSMNASSPMVLEPVKTVAEALSLLGLAGEKGQFWMLDDQLFDTKIWLLKKVLASETLNVFHEEAAEMLRFVTEI